MNPSYHSALFYNTRNINETNFVQNNFILIPW